MYVYAYAHQKVGLTRGRPPLTRTSLYIPLAKPCRILSDTQLKEGYILTYVYTFAYIDISESMPACPLRRTRVVTLPSRAPHSPTPTCPPCSSTATCIYINVYIHIHKETKP